MGEMYSEFLKYALGDGKELGIVLTPPYITKMMAEILDINKDNRVMDLATGSAGFLISAMQIMIENANENYAKGSSEALKKIDEIKVNQLLGVELNAEMYTLAATNMILRGDGSARIEHGSAFNRPDELYSNFKADRILLNPPFTFDENGMPFIAYGLDRMAKGGLGAIIIQDSAGSGKAVKSNQKILKSHTLLASIKMPVDLFVPVAGVQTSIYIFKAHEPHDFERSVKFIDFRNDGYKRTSRSLQELDEPTQRYADIVKIYKAGRAAKVSSQLWNLDEIYVEDFITGSGMDWNFDQHKKIDTMPTLADFKKSVSDYLSWEVSQILKKDSPSLGVLSQKEKELSGKPKSVKWEKKKLEELFESSNGNFDIKKEHINGFGEYVVTAGLGENGILGKTDVGAKIFDANTITVDMFGNAFYRNFRYKMVTHARVFCLKPLFEINSSQGLFLAAALHFLKYKFGYDNMCSWVKIKNEKILLPTLGGKINFSFMEKFIEELDAYLRATGLKNYELTQSEKSAFAKFDEFNKRGWVAREFTLESLFDNIRQGRRLKKQDQKAGAIPFIMAGVTNNGVANYISNPVAKFPANSITVDIFGNTFYRDYEFGAGDDTGVYYNVAQTYTKETMLYFTTVISKSLFGKFSYGQKLRSSQSLNFKIKLPTKNGEIDYKFMENFIKAIEKLVIKDVVLWADKKIEATKKVINKA